MRLLAIAFLGPFIGLSLTGCNTVGPTLIDKQLVTVSIPESVWQCENVRLPDPAKMTNRQLANLLVDLKTANVKCYNTIQAIEAYLKQAGVVLEKKD